MSVADIILQQLGGKMFVMLTGAKNFVTNGHDLTMQLPRGKGMRITLNGRDYYDIDYYAYRGLDIKDLGQRTDVSCEELKDVFEELTGLYVTFHKRVAA